MKLHVLYRTAYDVAILYVDGVQKQRGEDEELDELKKAIEFRVIELKEEGFVVGFLEAGPEDGMSETEFTIRRTISEEYDSELVVTVAIED